jgi:hypothetical protein
MFVHGCVFRSPGPSAGQVPFVHAVRPDAWRRSDGRAGRRGEGGRRWQRVVWATTVRRSGPPSWPTCLRALLVWAGGRGLWTSPLRMSGHCSRDEGFRRCVGCSIRPTLNGPRACRAVKATGAYPPLVSESMRIWGVLYVRLSPHGGCGPTRVWSSAAAARRLSFAPCCNGLSPNEGPPASYCSRARMKRIREHVPT